MRTGISGFFCIPGGIYAYQHNYNTEKGYTVPKNTTIGKCTDDDSELIYPNTNFLKFFPADEMLGDIIGKNSGLFLDLAVN